MNIVYTSCSTSCQTTENLGSQGIGKYQENLKTSKSYSLVPSLPLKMKFLSILAKTSLKQRMNFSRSVLFHMKISACLKYFVRDWSFAALHAQKRQLSSAVVICALRNQNISPLLNEKKTQKQLFWWKLQRLLFFVEKQSSL